MASNMTMRTAIPVPPDPLYHYTTLAGIHGIATTKHLWATSIRHLNDATEFMYAHGVLRSALEQQSRGQPADVSATIEVLLGDLDFRRISTSLAFVESSGLTFVTSFSKNKDQLSQWRAYCPGGGFALGFRVDALQTIGSEQGFELVQCSYDKQHHVREAETIASEILALVSKVPADARKRMPAGGKRIPAHIAHHIFPIRQQMLDEIQQRAPTWKHPNFREEDEWRLVSSHRPATDFRVGRTAIIPYVEIQLDCPSLMNGDLTVALEETVIGPCPEPELTVGSVMHLFGTQNVACPGYVLSNTPYRQW